MPTVRQWKSFALLVSIFSVAAAGLVFGQAQQDNFHHTAKTPKVDYDGLFAAAEPLDESASGREVLAACLAAYSEDEKLSNLQGFRLEYGSVEDPEDRTTWVAKSLERGRRYRVTAGGKDRILNGRKCWYQDPGQLMDMDGGRYRAELFSYLTLAMPLAAETENFTGIRYGKRADDPLDYLYFDKADSLMIILGLDAADHRIRTSTGIIRQDPGQYVFINEFSDYRLVEGFWFPHHLVNISMGLKVADSVLRKVLVNPGFTPDEFLPAGGDGK